MENDVLFEVIAGEAGHIGVIILNRPKVLNALNHAMVTAIHTQLNIWENAHYIKAVIIKSSSNKAFCAGGDLRFTYNQKDHIESFFRDEYQLNRSIFHFPKPYIALLNGITMGGGVGLSIHGSHRLATKDLVFAMPETGIGFFPDVGGTYFLSRIPFHLGYYLGLTGRRLNVEDCLFLGLVNKCMSEEEIARFIDLLINTPLPKGSASVNEILDLFPSSKRELSFLFEQELIVDACFSAHTVEEIIVSLEQINDDFCQHAIKLLAQKSPTSLKVTLLALQKGELLNFDECMREEYNLTRHFLTQSDFMEGIRALIVDKDQSPQWRPPTLREVSEKTVLNYFTPS